MKKAAIWFCTIGIVIIIGMIITLVIDNFKKEYLYWIGWLCLYYLALICFCLVVEAIADFCIAIFKFMSEIFEEVM